MPWLTNPHRFGTAPPITGDDFFAADGATLPWHGWTFPNAFHVASTNTTWLFWEAFGPTRGARVTTLDHDTDLWSAHTWIALHTLVDDAHGTPSAARDADGYVHAYFGAHDSGTLLEFVTASPDDPSTWVHRTTFSADEYTYPHPLLVGSQLYLFAREHNVGGTKRTFTLRKTTALTGGVPTWGAIAQIIDWGADSRVYVGVCVLVGTDIHLIATFTPNDGDPATDVYHFIYDTTDGSVHNTADSFSVASGSLPVGLTDSNTNFRIVTQTTTQGHYPAFCVDSAGNLHVAYLDGDGSTWDLKHLTSPAGGPWGSPTTVTASLAVGAGAYIALVPLPAGEVALYYPDDPTAAWTVGGNIVRKIRSAGGSWGSATTVLTATGYALNQPTPVRDAHADARVTFSEIAQNDLDTSGGDLKLYAYGDGGFLIRPTVAPSAITITSTKVYAGAGIGDTVGVLRAVDTDSGDTFTFTITSDPDSKFTISGNKLTLEATVTAPNTHSVTVRATDSFGKTKDQAFTITAVATVDEVNDSYLAQVKLLLDAEGPTAGTDASIASVVLLLDGSGF